MTSSVLTTLESVLGSSVPKSKGNHAFHCPFCNHAKPKLEIHPETQNWNCWVCGTSGKSLYVLFKKVNAKPHFFQDLRKYLPKNRNFHFAANDANAQTITLPKEYSPLWIPKPKNFMWNTCIEYLKKRGISPFDIFKYRLGYCESGIYKNMIIFPNYDKFGRVNYFTTRSFLNSASKKFSNPPVSKNVVGFELQVNWNMPIILVESALDAIILKRNAIPLYGTIIQSELKTQIVENAVETIYMALDSDALIKSFKYVDYFMGLGINVHLVELPEGSDPNSLGYETMWELIETTPITTESKLFEYKLKNKL